MCYNGCKDEQSKAISPYGGRPPADILKGWFGMTKNEQRMLLAGLAYSAAAHCLFCILFLLFDRFDDPASDPAGWLCEGLFVALLAAAVVVYILLQKGRNSPHLFLGGLFGQFGMAVLVFRFVWELVYGWYWLLFFICYVIFLFVISVLLIADLIRLVIRKSKQKEKDGPL